MIRLILAALILLSTPFLTSAAEKNDVYYTLNGDIEQGNLYGLEDILYRADKNTTIHIDISTYGGSYTEVIKIIHAMRLSQGETSCKVDKIAASGGAIIASMCDKLEVTEGSVLVYHMVHLGYFQAGPYTGKYSIAEVSKQMLDFIGRDCIQSLFDNDEVYESFLLGADIWLNTPEQIAGFKENSCKVS